MQTIDSTDDVTLAVHDLGGEGPTIVFSHATGLHGLLWVPLARALAGYHSIAIDYRGHGDATAPVSGSYNWGGFRDDAVAVIDTLTADLPLLGVGHSMGGAVLLMAELARPGTFRALALYEPIVFPDPGSHPVGDSPIVSGARRRRPEFPSREVALTNFSAKPPLDVLDPEVLSLYVDHGFEDTPDGTIRLKCQPETEARTFEGSAGHDIYTRLGEVRCPVLVMAAPAADGTPAAFADDVALGAASRGAAPLRSPRPLRAARGPGRGGQGDRRVLRSSALSRPLSRPRGLAASRAGGRDRFSVRRGVKFAALLHREKPICTQNRRRNAHPAWVPVKAVSQGATSLRTAITAQASAFATPASQPARSTTTDQPDAARPTAERATVVEIMWNANGSPPARRLSTQADGSVMRAFV